ncbi:MAG: outer membrane protein assembly factor BamD [Betaproteobacteria bacterium]|nr:outer membrane protein assembly factor BamD [Betaproteobacteria bacterium]
MKYILIFTFTLLLNACVIFGDPTELDDTKGWSAERIYQEGAAKMADKDYEKAIVYFQKLESRYPHGRFAAQAQLETAYAYYKKQEPILALAAADRFIKLHPNHPNVDYAYYLKGLAVFNERGIMEKLSKQEISDRDPRALKDSFASFKELVIKFPKSRYAKDSTQRMQYLANSLSEHELHVARYYMKRQAYLAALNRTKYVLEYYPQSPSVEEALVIMISAYDFMEMTDLKDDTMRILKTNYPDSIMLRKNAPQDERVWWKFWDSMY